MSHKVLGMTLMMLFPLFSFASFTEMYGTWVERLLGNPTATYEQLKTRTNWYGQTSNIEASIIAPEGEWTITVTTDMYTNTGNNIAWAFTFQASWTVDEQSAAIDLWAEIIVASGTMYAKPQIKAIPTDFVSTQEAIGFQFLDGKWLETTNTLWVNAEAVLSAKPLEINQKLVSLVKENPVFTSTYETKRNGYTIHVLDINQAGIEQLFAWVVNTITTPLWLPAESTMILPPDIDLKQSGVKTFGVIGQKGDEIKMWLLVKQNPWAEYVFISSAVTPTTSALTFRLAEKKGNKPLVQFWYDTETKSATELTTKINFFATEDDLDIESTITSSYYDATSKPEITAPTGAILLSDIMAQ